MESKLKKMKGITLIALVVTIVVLLILAGASIAMLTGDSGIIIQAKRAREENAKGEIKEELELEITDMRANKASKGEELTKQEVIDKMTEKGVVITDSEGDIIQGEYKDYEVTIDENYNVTVGGALTGAKPEVTVESLNTEADADSVQIKVTASTTDGEIASIEATNGAILKTDTSSTEKIFEVGKNGKYYFKVKGTNGRIAIEPIEVNNIYTGNSSLLQVISEITKSGEQEALVRGKTSAGTKETKGYKLNVLYSKNDLVLDGTTPAVLDDGEKQITVTPNSKVYYFGSAGDIGTASTNAKNTVVLKVEGNLIINSGVKVTSVGSNYGGPKGMIIYCTGTLTNNGEISMTARGAKAPGENVYLWKNSDGSYEYVPAVGGTGGVAVKEPSNSTVTNGKTGIKGNNGIGRTTGGGGSGGAVWQSTSGKGGNGTSYSGGTGGGGSWNNATAQNGDGYGGKGGNGIGNALYTWGTGGGAGNPGGTHQSNAVTGSNGTGGLLVIYANVFSNNNMISANGSNGGNAYRGAGGASGGGSINIFYNENLSSSTAKIQVVGGTGGKGTRSDGQTANGGAGGTGSITSGSIEIGTFRKK